MADLTCEQKHQDFFYRNLSSLRTCVSNSTALTLTQTKIQALKFWPYVPYYSNKYVKEKNTTTLAIYHGSLLVTTDNYL